MAYKDIDPEAVAAGIKEGKAITQSFMAEMNVKAINAKELKAMVEASPENAETKPVKEVKAEGKEDKTEVDAKAKALADASAEVFAALNIKESQKN